MASILRVNTLTDASSNNSIATSFIAGGSAKSWVNFNGTSTLAVRDSLNTTSVTDNSTGNYSFTLSNAMGNADYNHTAGTISDTAQGANFITVLYTQVPTTTVLRINAYAFNGTIIDPTAVFPTIHGDLA